MTKYQIEQVLPHRQPMILVDNLIEYDEDTAVCGVLITVRSPFYNVGLGGVSSYIGCEYMAQSIAAYAGANALDNNEQVKVGFLLGSRKYRTYTPVFKAGEALRVRVEKLVQEDNGLGVFDCAVLAGDKLLAEAKINVFQPDDAIQFIRENG